jgi:hypothetical protein
MQSQCYFQEGHYNKKGKELGEACMKNEYNSSFSVFSRKIDIVNYSMFVGVTIPLVTLPYLLRSIRIYKMFKAREEFCITEKLPRKTIHRWSERNMLIVLACYIVFNIATIVRGSN